MNDIANPLRHGLLDDRTGDACAVVIFGASGDLTRRKLMPALYNLSVSRVLPGNFAVVGVARRRKEDDAFKAEMKEGVAKYSRRKVDPALWDDFERSISGMSIRSIGRMPVPTNGNGNGNGHAKSNGNGASYGPVAKAVAGADRH